MRLPPEVYSELNDQLSTVDEQLRVAYPGSRPGRQPVHTVYVPADRYHAGTAADWGQAALAALTAHQPAPFEPDLRERVESKLRREPVEDLRIDFEDGYRVRDEAVEDADARSAATALASASQLPSAGLRCKSLEATTRQRAVRTLDVFLSALLDALGRLPAGFVITLPKVSAVRQVEAMSVLCGRLEEAYGLATGALCFEVQVETPAAVLGPDGRATLAGMLRAGQGRCVGLHFGTYDYTAACGIAAGYQSMEHPAAEHAKAVMQVAAAGTGVRLSDGSCNVLPVGGTEAVQAAWALHARLVRRSLERGFYQGWDLHPAQLPSRYGVTYGFFREGLAAAAGRLRGYLSRRPGAVLDEPATARALAGFLLRGLDCGAFEEAETGLTRPALAQLGA